MHSTHNLLRATPLLLFLALEADAAPQFVESEVRVLRSHVGESLDDRFGWNALDVGDMDLDGVGDYVVTAPFHDSVIANGGRMYAYSGATGAELFRISGSQGGGRLGEHSWAAGDVDQDGRADVIVGAPFSGRGRAMIYSGASTSEGPFMKRFIGEAQGDRFGATVGGGRDVDGDGTVDVIIGAPGHDSAGNSSGRAYVYSGADFSLICTVDGPSTGATLGSGVALLRDVTGDGRAEFVVGAPGAGGAGRVYVYSFDGVDCSLLHTLLPGPGVSNLGGYFVTARQDLDADGFDDVVVGDFPANRVNVFSGIDGVRILELSGQQGYGLVESISDRNGDGHGDLLTQEALGDLGATDAGEARIQSGKDGRLLQLITHTLPQANFGTNVDGIGDLDGDGVDDLLIAADGPGEPTGRVWVLAGVRLPESTCAGAPNSVGPGAELFHDGSVGLGTAELALEVTGAVPGEVGIFFYGPDEAAQPFGNGLLCVSGPSYRLYPPMVFDAAGTARRDLDFASVPLGAGPGQVLAGATWHFQAWYRDTVGAAFNTSNGLSVLFQD